MKSEGRNLQAICAALDSHAARCDGQVTEIRMAQYEVERLDWSEVRGIPVRPDNEMGTGRLRLVCDAEQTLSPPKRTLVRAPA